MWSDVKTYSANDNQKEKRKKDKPHAVETKYSRPTGEGFFPRLQRTRRERDYKSNRDR